MNTASNASKRARWREQFVRNGESDAEASPSASSSPSSTEAGPFPIRIILADSEAIFRVGMSKIFALENDLAVVAQTETLPQTLNAVATVPADVVLFEAGLSPTPAEAISEVARRALPGTKLIMVTQRAGEQE